MQTATARPYQDRHGSNVNAVAPTATASPRQGSLTKINLSITPCGAAGTVQRHPIQGSLAEITISITPCGAAGMVQRSYKRAHPGRPIQLNPNRAAEVCC